MSNSLHRLFAVAAITLGSLGLVAPAFADCGANHQAQASSSDHATGPTASTDQASASKASGG